MSKPPIVANLSNFYESMEVHFSESFEGTVESLAQARKSTKNYLENVLLLQKSQIIDIEIALGEVLQNIVRYGYFGGDKNKSYSLEIIKKELLLKITAKDYARPIDDLSFLTKAFQANESGGMGLSIIKKLTTSYSIEPQIDGNLHILNFSI